MDNTATENGTSKQGVYVQVPEQQSPPLYPQVPQGYQQQPDYRQQPGQGYQQQPAYRQQPGQGYQQQPAYRQQPAVVQQPIYGYSTQPPVAQVQPPSPAADAENPWASPVPRYQQPPQWGKPQTAAPVQQAPQWGQPQQPVYSQLPAGGSQYRPLDDTPKDRQTTQSVTIPLPALQAWTSAPYDRRAGSSFGNSNSGNAWSGGYSGYGYPGYAGAPYGGAPYGGGWPGGYMAGPGGWPGRW